MNPIKNKKNLETLVDEIRNLAYTYIEKYSPSKQQLKTYLFKKLIKKDQKTINKQKRDEKQQRTIIITKRRKTNK